VIATLTAEHIAPEASQHEGGAMLMNHVFLPGDTVWLTIPSGLTRTPARPLINTGPVQILAATVEHLLDGAAYRVRAPAWDRTLDVFECFLQPRALDGTASPAA
jgi:hypothetical protein